MIFVLCRNLLCEIAVTLVLEGNFRFNLEAGSSKSSQVKTMQVKSKLFYASQVKLSLVETIQNKTSQVKANQSESKLCKSSLNESSRIEAIQG